MILLVLLVALMVPMLAQATHECTPAPLVDPAVPISGCSDDADEDGLPEGGALVIDDALCVHGDIGGTPELC